MKSSLQKFAVLAAMLTASAQARLNVVATTPDLGALAREIGGDKIELTILAKPTEDPHFVESKPSFIVKLNRADVLIEGGAELESGWLSALVQQARNNKIQDEKSGRIHANEGISMLEVPAELDRSKGDIHAGGNPHFLTDPANSKIVAQHITEVFCRLDAASCELFKSNLQKYEALLEAKLVEWQKTLAPYKDRKVVTYHNSWPYFAKRFGVRMDLFLEPKPGIPPSPSHLAQVITQMKKENARVIVVQPYQNRRTAETVAGHADAAVVHFPTFPGGKGTESYLDWMDALVKALVNGFEEKK